MHAGLPALHSGPAKLMQVCLTSSVGMDESTVAVPGLSFPRRQAWQKLPALELTLSEVPRAGESSPLIIHNLFCMDMHALQYDLQGPAWVGLHPGMEYWLLLGKLRDYAYLLAPEEYVSLTIELRLGCVCADCCPLARVRIYTVSPELLTSFAQ